MERLNMEQPCCVTGHKTDENTFTTSSMKVRIVNYVCDWDLEKFPCFPPLC